MKKLNNYKIAFLFSLVPCVVFLFVVTVVAISGYGYNMGRHAYGMVAVGNWLGNIGDYWFDFNIRHIIIFTCLIYQTTYILALRSLPYKENHQTGIGVKSNRKTGKAAKIFLWLSFVPYAFVILMSICSAIFGTREWAALFGEGRLIYGFEALQQDIFLLTAALTIVFPVIPICLVYQIVYLTVKIVKKRKTKASTESDDTEPIFDDSHENRETSVQNDFPIIKKVTLIVTFVAWGFFCMIL
ncbi:MAG: hypothetical protein FWF82_04800 [Oscillospiraceae bacterium]|nr:hypothetical protein [Oscillospiraceae bacterium]